MRVEDYQKHMDVVTDLAYVEYDLREQAGQNLTSYDDPEEHGAKDLAMTILFERFGLDT